MLPREEKTSFGIAVVFLAAAVAIDTLAFAEIPSIDGFARSSIKLANPRQQIKARRASAKKIHKSSGYRGDQRSADWRGSLEWNQWTTHRTGDADWTNMTGQPIQRLDGKTLESIATKDICTDCVAGAAVCGSKNSGELATGDCELGDGTLVDMWSLELTEERLVDITLQSDDLDPFVFVMDSGCELIARSDICDFSFDDSQACTSILLEPGNYFIGANGFSPGKEGTYELSVECSEPVCTACDAGSVACGSTVSGELSGGDCDSGFGSFMDVWSFELADRSLVDITLDSQETDPILIVSDSACEPFAFNDDCDGLNSCLSLILDPGVYFINATTFNPGETGDYDVGVFCSDPPDIGTNDDCSDPTIISSPSFQPPPIDITGATTDPNDPIPSCGLFGDQNGFSVWYNFEAPEDGVINVNTIGSNYDTLLTVFEGECDSLTEIGCDDDTGGDFTSAICNLPVTAGQNLLIEVADLLIAGGGILDFEFEFTPGPVGGACTDCLAGSIECDSFATGDLSDASCLECDGKFAETWRLDLPSPARVQINLTSSELDPVLNLLDADCKRIATNDDCESLNSCLTRTLDAGVYYVEATSYSPGETGSYAVGLSCFECTPPAPSGPSPSDGETNLPDRVELTWGGSPENLSLVQSKVVYGQDDRLDLFEVTDPAILEVAQSTAALVSTFDLFEQGDDTVALPTTTFNDFITIVYGSPLCSGEPFADQPAPAFCSGFLVGPDLVATAGHCIFDSFECSTTAFVFGFEMVDEQTSSLPVPVSNVYTCVEVVDRILTFSNDWGIFRVDRPVEGRMPLTFRQEGIVPDDAPLVLVGHPVGLPTKVAGGATVRNNNPAEYFSANLDAYGGNSGSAVFHADDFVVEGILVRGVLDFEFSGNCVESAICPDDGCFGEEATRATEFAPAVDIAEYDVYFGTDCESLDLLGTTQEFNWTVDVELLPGTEYCWQAVARNRCGESDSSVWTFTTAASPDDIDADKVANSSDNCPNSPNEDQSDRDGDGSGDVCDACPDDGSKIQEGACGCGAPDDDGDGDGEVDCRDECPDDPLKIRPGICGCGSLDIDDDGDGALDCTDECPDDPSKLRPGECGCGTPDSDTDGDGTLNCNDSCLNDPTKVDPGVCGCGSSDADSDGSGVPDCQEQAHDIGSGDGTAGEDVDDANTISGERDESQVSPDVVSSLLCPLVGGGLTFFGLILSGWRQRRGAVR
jgi:hypothetical protein